jgi:hypothetical protein
MDALLPSLTIRLPAGSPEVFVMTYVIHRFSANWRRDRLDAPAGRIGPSAAAAEPTTRVPRVNLPVERHPRPRQHDEGPGSNSRCAPVGARDRDVGCHSSRSNESTRRTTTCPAVEGETTRHDSRKNVKRLG